MEAGDVFGLLLDGRPRTRAQLSRATGIGRATIAARIDELMRLGLVTPIGGGVSTGGRPPSMFAMNPRARLVAGVDIGASHVSVVLADLSGEVLARTSIDIAVSDGPEPVLSYVCDSISALLAQYRQDENPSGAGTLAAIGMGLPGPVEAATGRPIDPPIMPGWDRYQVPARVQRDHPVPVLVDNDVNIMALGEQRTVFGSTEDLVFVKVATGIGAGIVSGGHLQRGALGAAGDIGHVRVPGADQVQCPCGNTGCLEAVAAGSALAAALRGAGLAADGVGEVVDLVRAGEPAALAAVRQAGRDIGDVLATVVNLLNPSVLVIGGRLAEAGEHLLAGIREVVYRRSTPLATAQLRVVASSGRDDAAAVGAVTLAIAHVTSPQQIARDVQTVPPVSTGY